MDWALALAGAIIGLSGALAFVLRRSDLVITLPGGLKLSSTKHLAVLLLALLIFEILLLLLSGIDLDAWVLAAVGAGMVPALVFSSVSSSWFEKSDSGHAGQARPRQEDDT